MNRPAILGLDPSLTGAGIAINGHAETIDMLPAPKHNTAWRQLTPTQRRHTTTLYRHQRLAHLTGTLHDRFLADSRIDLVVLEGLAYDAHDTDRQLAGLSWLIRQSLWRLDIPYAVVPPATLKQFATGTGNATKADVQAAVAAWFPWFDGDDNAADATVLMAMGHAALETPLISPLSHKQATAMESAAWPDLEPLRAAYGPTERNAAGSHP